MVCSYSGCERPAYKTGLCNGHYIRKRRGYPAMDAPFPVPRTGPCTVDGCGRPRVAYGLCNAHRLRRDRGGDTKSDRPVKVHLYSRSERLLRGVPLPRQVPGQCWEWTGARDADGYGQLHGDHTRANRAAYVEWVGPIPDGLWVCHRCDNPPCINPEHLFLGTPQDNAVDMVSKNRHGKYDPNARNPRRRDVSAQPTASAPAAPSP